jgi:hypothetical protein
VKRKREKWQEGNDEGKRERMRGKAVTNSKREIERKKREMARANEISI